MTKKISNQILKLWWHYLVLSTLCFAGFFAIAIRAIDTGSLLQYTAGFIVLAIGINQFIKTIATLRK